MLIKLKDTLPQRKKIRLSDYNYSQENIYFITICVRDRLKLLIFIERDDIRNVKTNSSNNRKAKCWKINIF